MRFLMMTHQQHTPSDTLLKRVRVALLLRDDTLTGWANANGCKRQNLTKALNGKWKGPRANALVARIVADLGLAE